MNEILVRAQGVSKFFGDFPALRNIDVELRAGRVLAMLGRNGAGKTTLLRILAGLTRPTQGEVTFPAFGGGPRGNRRRIGVVGHGTWIYDELTAEENIRFFSRLYGVSDPARAASTWLARVGLERFRNARAGEYSRGMRQRLTVARAFLHDPSVLLLDEPWTALDDRAMHLLSSLVREARARGCSTVICSHQLREAVAVASEVALLHRGRIVFAGPADEGLRRDPQSLYSHIQ